MSNWPDGTVQTQSGCTIPAGAPLCGDCGNGFRFPPGQARTQQAGLTDFCGAAAPQHRRGAPVSRVWGRHSPTSSRPGEQMSGAKFGPRVDTCSPLFLIKWKSFLLRSTHFVPVEAVTPGHRNQFPMVFHSLDTFGNPPVADTQLTPPQHLTDKLSHPECSIRDMGANKWVVEVLSYTVQTAIDNGTQGGIFFSKLRPLHSDSSADIFGDFPLQRQIRRPVPRR